MNAIAVSPAPLDDRASSCGLAPRLTDGVELLGEYRGSGSEEPPYLLGHPDGRVIQLSRLLHLIAANLDGSRNLQEVAAEVSADFGRPVSVSNVQHRIEQQLRPLGVTSDGAARAPLSRPVLALTWRSALVPRRVVNAAAAPFRPLFLPMVVASVLAGLVVFDAWLLFAHGIGAGLVQVFEHPELQLLLSVAIFASGAFHELGHATACRYAGVQPGVIGVGIYLVWPVFYNDVTDSYRLDRVGRLRVDLGGVYFDAVAVLVTGGAYFITGFEPLLLLAVALQLDAMYQFLPFLRFDGYYILSDLTGVPDLFAQAKPLLAGMLRRKAHPAPPVLKPRVRKILTVWLVATIAFLTAMLAILLVNVPRYLPVAWTALVDHVGHLQASLQDENLSGVLLGVVRIGILVLPLIGGALVTVKLSALARRALRRSGSAEPRLATAVEPHSRPELTPSFSRRAFSLLRWAKDCQCWFGAKFRRVAPDR